MRWAWEENKLHNRRPQLSLSLATYQHARRHLRPIFGPVTHRWIGCTHKLLGGCFSSLANSDEETTLMSKLVNPTELREPPFEAPVVSSERE